MKIGWLEIENFRGIKYLKLDSLGDVNIFIGKNNTGKSTILESIYLNVTWREKVRLDFLEEKPWELIRKKRGEGEGGVSEYWAYKRTFPIKITSLNLGTTHISGPVIPSYETKRENVVLLYPEIIREASFALRVRNAIADLGAKALKDVTNLLKEFLGLDDLEFIEESEGKLFFLYSDRRVPISGEGDGIRIVFPIIGLLGILKESIILIEEPEVHQHYRSIEMIANSIPRSVKNNKNQIFITTQSLEFFKILLPKLEKINTKIFRCLELKKGTLNYKVYDAKSALAAIESIGLDLR